MNICWAWIFRQGHQYTLFPIEKTFVHSLLGPLERFAVVVEILLDRIQEISRKPTEEAVVIVTQGARDKDDNNQWLQVLQRICARN